MNRRKVISEMKAHCERVAAVMAADTYDFSQSGVPVRPMRWQDLRVSLIRPSFLPLVSSCVEKKST